MGLRPKNSVIDTTQLIKALKESQVAEVATSSSQRIRPEIANFNSSQITRGNVSLYHVIEIKLRARILLDLARIKMTRKLNQAADVSELNCRIRRLPVF